MKILKVLLVCLMSLLLFGCSYTEADIKVDAKGNYTISGFIVFSKDNLEQVEMSVDECLEIIAITGYDLRNSDLEPIERIVDGVEYVGYSFENVQDLPIHVELEGKFIPDIHFSADRFYSELLNTNLLEDQTSDLEYLKKIGLVVSINVTFPGEIKHANVGDISRFNKLNLNMVDLIEGVNVVASSSFLSLYMWGLVTLITIIVLVIILKKRLSQSRRVKNIIKYSDHQLLALQKTNSELAEAFKDSDKSKYQLSRKLRKAIRKRGK